MRIPETEAELLLLPSRIRPPRRLDTRRARYLLEALLALPALEGFQTPDDQEEIFEQALEFHRANRPGLYIAFMLPLAMTGNGIGCLTIASILIQRANAAGVTNRNGLLRRAYGWLGATTQWSLIDAIRPPEEVFADMRRAGESASKNPMNCWFSESLRLGA